MIRGGTVSTATKPDLIDLARPGHKGLRSGALGLVASVVIGVASTAPAYSVAATIGLVVTILGVHTPAMLVVAFVPMLFVAFAFRELNQVEPDCGTNFTWAVRAFGPRTGWMSGWGVLVACIVVMSSVSQIAARYAFLLVGADGLANSTFWVTTGGVAFIALLTWVCYLGIEISSRLQFVLLAIELASICIFAVAALVKVYTGHKMSGGSHPSLSWFNPLSGSFSDLAAAFLLVIFIYWGWDTSLSVNEETKDSSRTPGRAAVIATVLLVVIFAVTSTALLAYAGPAFLAANTGDVLGAVGASVLGGGAVKILILSVLTSAAASTQTTIMPAARVALSMGAHGALPARFARVDPRRQTPGFTTIAIGVVSVLIFIVLSLVSTNVLADSASAVGVLIAFYYGLTALACPWLFRHTLRGSRRNLFMRGILPVIGGLFMIAAFVESIKTYLPAANSYSSIGGVGGIFILGIGSLVLGLVVMVLCAPRFRAFFTGQTLSTRAYEEQN
jgi:amino acid transporter